MTKPTFIDIIKSEKCLGFFAGVGLFAVEIGTMIFGANEMVAAITGTNYIQRGLGMSDAAYALAFLKLILWMFGGG